MKKGRLMWYLTAMFRLLSIIMIITFMAPFFSPLAANTHGKCHHSSEKECDHKFCPMKKEAAKSGHSCHVAEKKAKSSESGHNCATHYECATHDEESASSIKIKEVPLTAFSGILSAVFDSVDIWPGAISEYSDYIPEGPFKPPSLA